MKRTLILFIVVFFTSGLFAQDAQITLGPFNKSGSRPKQLSRDNTGTYYLKGNLMVPFTTGIPTVARINDDLLESKFRKIEGDDKAKQVEFLVPWNGKLYLFGSYKELAKKKYTLTYQEVDVNSLESSHNAVTLADMSILPLSFENFGYDLSENGSRLLIYYNMPNNSHGNVTFGVKVFNNEFQELWAKELSLDYKDSGFALEDFAVDDDGNVFVTGVKINTINRATFFKDADMEYEYKVFAFAASGENANELPIEFSGYSLRDMDIVTCGSGKLICSGFAIKGTDRNLGAVFCTEIDGTDGGIIHSSIYDLDQNEMVRAFPASYKGAIIKSLEKNKYSKEFNYYLKSMQKGEDGTIYIIGESKVTTVSYSTSSSGSSTRHVSNKYYNIFCVKFNTDCSLAWISTIPRCFSSSGDDPGIMVSFSSVVANNKLYVFYNDQIKNTAKPMSEPVKIISKPDALVMASFDEEGNVERKVVVTVKESKCYAAPVVSLIEENSLTMLLTATGKYRLVNFDFK